MADMAEGLTARGIHVMRGQRCVVRDVTLHARPGEVTAVIGPNGAGKSTLLRAVAGVLPYTGSVTLDGRPMESCASMDRARLLSFVPQNSLLTAPVRVRDVVAQGRYPHLGAFRVLRAVDQQAVEAAMQQTDIVEFAGRRYTQLSFGEQRRVLLARALATGAHTILLDEPTASLDIAHALRLFQQLRRLAGEGHTVVVVLHQLEHVLKHTDRALILHHGEARALGPCSVVIQPELIREVYGVDLRTGEGPEFFLPEDAP